jgi:hypothetical protein
MGTREGVGIIPSDRCQVYWRLGLSWLFDEGGKFGFILAES